MAAADHHRGVAARGRAGHGGARGGDPRRGRGRGVPARAPRPRDDRRRAVVRAGGPVRGALAARADALARAERRRARRDRRGVPRLRGQRRRGRASRSSSCTPRTAICWRSSCRRRRTPARSAAGSRIVERIVREIRASRRGVVVGIRLSIDGGDEAPDALCDAAVATLVDYVNLTVGVRTTYVRDMATEEPPLLGRRRAAPATWSARRCSISQAFRTPDDDRGRAGSRRGPRRHGARADRRSGHAAQAARRAGGGDPPVRGLQRGLPRVRPGPAVLRQPRPRAAREPTAGPPRRSSCAAPAPPAGASPIVGAGPAGLECALTLAGHARGRGVRLARGHRRPARRRRGGAASQRVARAAGLLRARASAGVELRLGRAGGPRRSRRLRRGGARGRCHRGPARVAGHRARAARPRRRSEQACAGATCWSSTTGSAGGRARARSSAASTPASRRSRWRRRAPASAPRLPPEGRVQLLARLRGAPLRGAPADRARPHRRRHGGPAQHAVGQRRDASPPTPSSWSASASRATGARSSRPRAACA